MIGDVYLQQRADLDNTLFALQLTAGELRAPADRLVKLHQLQENLREPFLFVVLGESRSGKSTLLNALFGREFFRVDTQPPGDRVCLYKYGGEEREVALGPHVTECQRQAAFLRNFNVLETPALGSLGDRRAEILGKFVPIADVVWFVFNAANPVPESAWEFLKLLGEDDCKRVVLVVQQIDRLGDSEAATFVAMLRKASVENAGQAFPVFTVSAKNALDAKLHGHSRVGGGFIELEQHLSERMYSSAKRKEKLEGVSRAAQGILKELRTQVDTASHAIQRDVRRVEQLQEALVEQKTQSIRQLEGFVWEVADAYEKAQKRGDEILLEKLKPGAAVKLIFNRLEPRYDFQRVLEEKLREKVYRQMESALEILDADLSGVGKQLDERIRGEFAAALPHGAEWKAPSSRKAELWKLIEPGLGKPGTNRQIEEQLGRMLAGTVKTIRIVAGLAVAFGVAAAATAFTHLAIGGILATFGVALAVALFVIVGVKRRRIVDAYNKYMADKRETLLESIEAPLRQAVDGVYADLGTRFQPVQAFCAARRKHYEPVTAKLEELGATIEKFSGPASKVSRVAKAGDAAGTQPVVQSGA